jgi:hypothetical protein
MKSKRYTTEQKRLLNKALATRPTASFRQNLDFLYNLNHIIITSRLTNHMAQFG